MASAPPTIFSQARRNAARRRLAALQSRPDAARFVMADMVEDVLDRLDFIRHRPARALVVGDWTGALPAELARQGAEVIAADPAGLFGAVPLELEAPYPFGDFDLIACLGVLDTVNDLPGALIHMRRALAPGGFAIASMIGGGSLPALRRALIAGDAERPAARLHPQIDVRSGAQLLQRAGWSHPVVDGHGLTVRYPSLDRLVEDLRAQGLGNALSSAPPPLGRAALARSRAAFLAQADEDGRVTERFEIVTLSGRRSLGGT